MKSVIEYLVKPENLYKIGIWLVMLVIAWTNLNNKIDTIANEQAEIRKLDLNSRIIRIESDVMWIRQSLESKMK